MFERFTDRARRVLVLAQEEARLLRHNFIGTEHLLLGLLQEEVGLGGQVLRSAGVRLDATRDRVAETIGDAAPGSAPIGSPPFTPRAKKVLELALREALQLNHNYIGTEHILLGILREGQGVACEVLVASGHPPGGLRQLVLTAVSDPDRQPGAESVTDSGPPLEPASLKGAPRCPSCGRSLAGEVAYRVLAAEPGDDEERTDRIEVLIAFCRQCGRAITSGPLQR